MPSSLHLRERIKGVCGIVVIVTTGFMTYPPVLAFLIVACCADEYYHIARQQIHNLQAHSTTAASEPSSSSSLAIPSSAAIISSFHRFLFVAASVLICISGLVSYEWMTFTAVTLTGSALAYLMFKEIETGEKVPVEKKKKKEEKPEKKQEDDNVDRSESTNSSSKKKKSSRSNSDSNKKKNATTPSTSPASTSSSPSSSLLLASTPVESAHLLHTVILHLFGLWYSGWLFGHSVLVLQNPLNNRVGTTTLTYVILTTALGENGGMLLGSRFGRTKLTPKISPNKSREGAIGQVVVSCLASLLFVSYFDIGISPLEAVPLGCALGCIGIMGDLFESFLKRSIGVKDAGRLIPGAGGMLDRMDGLIFNFPLMYYWIQYVHPFFIASR